MRNFEEIPVSFEVKHGAILYPKRAVFTQMDVHQPITQVFLFNMLTAKINPQQVIQVDEMFDDHYLQTRSLFMIVLLVYI